MEASAAGRPPAQTQPPPPPQLTEEAALAALTVVLLSNAGQEVVEAQVQALMAPLGIAAGAVKLALPLVLGAPSDEHMPERGLASQFVRRTSTPRRAAYLLSALRRFQAGGELETERRYLGQHLGAERSRIASAARVDLAAAEHGPVLGWYAKQPFDEASTPGCRAAHGHNFNVARPVPLEGELVYPGAEHGGAGRCRPGRPFSGGRLLN